MFKTPTLVLGYETSDSDPSKSYPIYWSTREQHAYCLCQSWKVGQYTDPVTGKRYFNRHLSPKDRCCKHLARFARRMHIAPGVVSPVTVKAAPPASPKPGNRPSAWDRLRDC
jgi:hypothetical protein